MKITDISLQAKNQDRANVSVDGKYRFSLDIFQVGLLGIKIGNEYSDEELAAFETESQFGKLYGRALEYSLVLPRSKKEVRDYLYRKTRDTRTKTGSVKKGVSKEITNRVYERLEEKGFLSDEKFALFWVENRHTKKGISKRKLQSELQSKGVDRVIIDKVLAETERDEAAELSKVIAKKRARYDDEQKFIQYLVRQGFRYDDIRQALADDYE